MFMAGGCGNGTVSARLENRDAPATFPINHAYRPGLLLSADLSSSFGGARGAANRITGRQNQTPRFYECICGEDILGHSRLPASFTCRAALGADDTSHHASRQTVRPSIVPTNGTPTAPYTFLTAWLSCVGWTPRLVSR